tara:strand:+ start:457 stop:1131 length:675 start_codon:yes stop_codon:yes gene_type:complete
MQRTSAPLFGAAILLAALAGFVDVLAYTSIGGFFASFMSGNTTQLGIGFIDSKWSDVFTAGSLILAFLSGVVISTVVASAVSTPAHARVMLTCTIFLVIGGILRLFGLTQLSVVALAAGMGAENGVFSRNGNIRIGLTYMTGTLVRFGQRLALALMGQDTRFAWGRDLLLWAGFFAGTLIGTACYRSEHDMAFWIAAAAAAVMTGIFALMQKARLIKGEDHPGA